jgi:hypothetical protein
MKSMLKALLLSAALFVVACGPLKYELKGAVLANGADAELLADVKKDQNLTTIDLHAINLPPPGRVKEGATTFVVWQRKNNDTPWTRIGALVYDEGARKGELLSVSVPELTFDLEVTAEVDAAGASPGDAIVFSQRVNG